LYERERVALLTHLIHTRSCAESYCGGSSVEPLGSWDTYVLSTRQRLQHSFAAAHVRTVSCRLNRWVPIMRMPLLVTSYVEVVLY
jgi:hypothetical protein